MNLEKLKAEESRFFLHYPGGFEDPSMKEIAKKHNIARTVALVARELSPAAFDHPEQALETLGKVITRSSLVSVFEKTALRNHLKALPQAEGLMLAEAFRELLHGDQETGFRQTVALLAPYKLAKWPLITCVMYYARPWQDIIVKPTTVKEVIAAFGLSELVYPSRPDYGFYRGYREQFLALKQAAGPGLQVENGAFSGFLMFALGHFE